MIASFTSVIWDLLTSEITYKNAVVAAAVLLFAASGEFVAEKAGTINISAEAMLLAGAFAAAMTHHVIREHQEGWNDNVVIALALVGAMVAGLLVAILHANMSHRLPADQFVVGLVINILTLGVVGYLSGDLDPQSKAGRDVHVPGLSEIPLVGEALFGQPWPLYLVYAVVPIVWWLVYRTRWGLEVRAIGEDPQAADVSGLHVNKRRRETLYVLGLSAGLGGGYFLYATAGLFEEGIIGGRGIIALAAVIFGGWTLKGTVAGCLLFGALTSFLLDLPLVGKTTAIPHEFLAMAPAVVTVLGMAIFATRVRQPRALARPFVRGLK